MRFCPLNVNEEAMAETEFDPLECYLLGGYLLLVDGSHPPLAKPVGGKIETRFSKVSGRRSLYPLFHVININKIELSSAYQFLMIEFHFLDIHKTRFLQIIRWKNLIGFLAFQLDLIRTNLHLLESSASKPRGRSGHKKFDPSLRSLNKFHNRRSQ